MFVLLGCDEDEDLAASLCPNLNAKVKVVFMV